MKVRQNQHEAFSDARFIAGRIYNIVQNGGADGPLPLAAQPAKHIGVVLVELPAEYARPSSFDGTTQGRATTATAGGAAAAAATTGQ